MKTIRLLYPDWASGNLEEYYFGSHLMASILPENSTQKLIKVEINPPDNTERPTIDGIYAKEDVIAGTIKAMGKIEEENPDRVITIGGNCMVSLPAFDYLHGKSSNTGIIWIDAHPDVSVPENGYPNAHSMVLGSLLGNGEKTFSSLMRNKPFKSDEILYVGLQPVHDYQERFLKEKYRTRNSSPMKRFSPSATDSIRYLFILISMFSMKGYSIQPISQTRSYQGMAQAEEK